MKRWKVFAMILGCILCFASCGKEQKDNGKPAVEPEETPLAAETETPAEPPVATETPALTVTPTPTVPPVQAESPAAGTSQGTDGKTNDGDAGQGQKYYATTGVNIRSSAGTDGDIKGTLARGEEIEGTGITDSGWTQVLYGGKKCFVYGDYLSSTPVTEEEPEEQQSKPQEQPADEAVSSETYSTWAFTVNLPESWQGRTGVLEEENGWGFYDSDVPNWKETKIGRVVSLRYYSSWGEWDTTQMDFKGEVGTSQDGSRYYILAGSQGVTLSESLDGVSRKDMENYSKMHADIEQFKAGLTITD